MCDVLTLWIDNNSKSLSDQGSAKTFCCRTPLEPECHMHRNAHRSNPIEKCRMKQDVRAWVFVWMAYVVWMAFEALARTVSVLRTE